jgi:predicted acyl esterase
VTRIGILGVAAGALAIAVAQATGAPFARQDVAIPMDDGVPIAATLYVPNGSPPAGGWPAVVLWHGIGGNREQLNAFVTAYGLVERDYVVLTVDARGHGQSGGLAGFAGARDVSDARAVHAWLAARPDVADTRVGAWGISYGGGIALNSLVSGVPWGAVVTVESWTDLLGALIPQGLAKSGALTGLAAAIPEPRRDPSLAPAFAAALAGSTAAVRPWALERSSYSRLGQVTAPVLIAPGRRDFLFGLDQGTKAYTRLPGSKSLFVGLHGHAPSSFPAADTPALLAEVQSFLDCHLRGLGCGTPTKVSLVPAAYPGTIVSRPGLPQTRTTSLALPGVATFAAKGKVVRRSAPLRGPLELFGTPQVKVTIAASGGWSRLVAVLVARTPQGRQLLVGAGGVPTRNGQRKVAINLPGQMLVLPKGSRLVLTLASSSLAQAKTNTTYLDLPLPSTARVRVGNAVVALPGLRQPVTK